jgi:hypothetical protein
MTVILNIKFPVQKFNEAVRDGTAGKKLERILEAVKPDAIYFTEFNGERGAVAIFHFADASKIPFLAEPWFLTFEASVELKMAMTAGDLHKAGLKELGKKWG